MRVLSFSSCFPSSHHDITGVFVLKRLAPLAKRVFLEVVHAMPWFPGYTPALARMPCECEELGGVRVHHIRFFYLPGILKSMDAWFYRTAVGRWLKGYFNSHGRPDLLDAHFIWPDGVAVSHLGRRFGIPVAITLRGKINSRIRRRLMRPQILSALHLADVVISVSRPMADLAVELGIPSKKIHIVPNGVDTDLFRPSPRNEARRALGLSGASPLVVSVAALTPSKGQDNLVDAVRRLPRDVHVVLVGSRVVHRRYSRALKRLIERHGLADRIIFAGRQPQEKVAQYLNAADVSVLASHSEGCPNVVLESLACGTPVVATSVGGVPEMIRPGENGELVPVKDPEALVAALDAALKRPWSRAAVRQSVANRSWEVVASEVLPVWERVVGREGRPSAGSQ